MARLSLAPGTWLGGVPLVLGGATQVIGAETSQPAIQYLGYAIAGLGILVLARGIKWRGEFWWRRLSQRLMGGRGKQLYLSFAGNKRPIIAWMPEYPWVEYRGDGSFSSWPPKESELPALAVDVHNAGPEPILHLRITWKLPDMDLATVIQSTELFGDVLKSVDDNRLLLTAGGAGCTLNLANTYTAKLPRLDVGKTRRLSTSRDFTACWVISTLVQDLKRGELPRITEVAKPDLVTKSLAEFTRADPVDGVKLIAEYEAKGVSYRQEFLIECALGTRMPAFSREKDSSGSYSACSSGVTVWMQGMKVKDID